MKKNMLAFLLISVLVSASIIGTPKVNAAKNDPYIDGYSQGYFIKAESNRIYFEEYDGTLQNIAFDGRTDLMIDDREVTINDFKKGMEIYMELEGRRIEYMDSFSTDLPGYISPDSKTRIGTVKKIDRNQITITTSIGTEETYFTSDGTLIIKNGKNSNLNTLYVGDRVKLQFSDIYSRTASKITIEGDSIVIKGLYKGELTVTNRMSSFVTLQNVERFRNGNWEKVGTVRLPYNSDLPLFLAGQKIEYRNLEHYKGKTVYMAMKDFFGQEGVEKMVIKNQYETIFSEKIESVNWYTSQIELSNKRNIGLHEGTMVIKNERLVDNYSVNSNSSALIVSDGRGGESTADVVYIYDEEINNSNIGMDRIYAGRIDNIGEYTLDLKDFFVLDKNEWESFSDTKELFFDNDTYIYDSEDQQTLTSKQLIDGEYHVDEDNMSLDDKRKKLKDYNAYIYTDGDRIAGIYLKKSMDSLLKQRITTATVSELKDDTNTGLTLDLRDVKDWSERLSKWNIKYSNMNLRIGETLIMKNGKNVKPEDLKQGDRLYIVRDDLVGKIIVVK